MEYEIDGHEQVSTAVVRAVSAVEGREPSSIPPLTDVLDPDALDVIFASQYNGEPRVGGRISFVYSRCRVSVENDEFLTVRLLENVPSTVVDSPSDRPTSRDGAGR
jgi:hypothetical protein